MTRSPGEETSSFKETDICYKVTELKLKKKKKEKNEQNFFIRDSQHLKKTKPNLTYELTQELTQLRFCTDPRSKSKTQVFGSVLTIHNDHLSLLPLMA